MNRVFLLSPVLMSCLAGCFGDPALLCEDSERYASSYEVAALQIPNDLDPPNESEALRVPRAPERPRISPEGPCMESPPDFYLENSSE